MPFLMSVLVGHTLTPNVTCMFWPILLHAELLEILVVGLRIGKCHAVIFNHFSDIDYDQLDPTETWKSILRQSLNLAQGKSHKEGLDFSSCGSSCLLTKSFMFLDVFGATWNCLLYFRCPILRPSPLSPVRVLFPQETTREHQNPLLGRLCLLGIVSRMKGLGIMHTT